MALSVRHRIWRLAPIVCAWLTSTWLHWQKIPVHSVSWVFLNNLVHLVHYISKYSSNLVTNSFCHFWDIKTPIQIQARLQANLTVVARKSPKVNSKNTISSANLVSPNKNWQSINTYWFFVKLWHMTGFLSYRRHTAPMSSSNYRHFFSKGTKEKPAKKEIQRHISIN